MIWDFVFIVCAGMFMVWDYKQWKAGRGDFFYPMVFGMWSMLIIMRLIDMIGG